MATGIRDKVAIIGMGCTRFGERWDVGPEALMVEAFEEAVGDAGIGKEEIEAAWLGTCFEEINAGKSALPLSLTLPPCPGGVRPTGQRLCRKARHPHGRTQASDGPCLGQEPRPGGAKSQGPPAESRQR